MSTTTETESWYEFEGKRCSFEELPLELQQQILATKPKLVESHEEQKRVFIYEGQEFSTHDELKDYLERSARSKESTLKYFLLGPNWYRQYRQYCAYLLGAALMVGFVLGIGLVLLDSMGWDAWSYLCLNYRFACPT